RLRHLPRRRDGLPQPRGHQRRRRPLRDRGPRQPQRHFPQPPPHRTCPALRRRRGADRQVPPRVPGAMTVAATYETAPSPRLQTIGAVCRRLKSEFPDISISKIRYLEDQGLLTPRRTAGGYRLFGEDDVDRLETILRMQRDEFLPLRVIRQHLAT